MTTTTASLTEFLLARIAEDEAAARWGRIVDDPSDPESATKILRWDHARLSAECEAKRRIVELYEVSAAFPQIHSDAWRALSTVLCDLAAVYADHPDYRDEWRS